MPCMVLPLQMHLWCAFQVRRASFIFRFPRLLYRHYTPAPCCQHRPLRHLCPFSLLQLALDSMWHTLCLWWSWQGLVRVRCGRR